MMKIIYSKQSKEQLFGIKAFISQDNKKVAVKYLTKLKNKIEILGEYPYKQDLATFIYKGKK